MEELSRILQPAARGPGHCNGGRDALILSPSPSGPLQVL